jgi:hypothetical protein
VHRFFMPLLPLIYLLAGKMAFDFFTEFRNRIAPRVGVLVVTFVALGLTFYLPRSGVLEIRSLEQGLVESMSSIASHLTHYFGSDLTLAASTVGSISYHSPNSRVIDMLGLTDREISHNPDYIPGIPLSWKERKYNAAYVLSQDPDFIIFSTQHKPSAPAERALFLYSQFRQNYYSLIMRLGNKNLSIFRRKGPYQKENEIFSDTRFVGLYHEALNLFVEKQWDRMVERLAQVLEVCPDDFPWVYEEMGKGNCLLGNHSKGKEYLIRAIEMDPYCISAHGLLAGIYIQEGKHEEALEEYQIVSLYDPGLVEKRISDLKTLIGEKKGNLNRTGRSDQGK